MKTGVCRALGFDGLEHNFKPAWPHEALQVVEVVSLLEVADHDDAPWSGRRMLLAAPGVVFESLHGRQQAVAQVRIGPCRRGGGKTLHGQRNAVPGWRSRPLLKVQERTHGAIEEKQR